MVLPGNIDVIAPLLEPDSHPGELCRDNPQIVERNVLNRNLALGHRGHADKTAHLDHIGQQRMLGTV